MNRDNRRVASEKPVVIVRKKTGKGSAPTGPTLPVSLPAPKSAAPAPFPEPPVQSMPLLLAHPQPPDPPDPPPLPAAPATADTGPSKREQEKQARRELLDTLRARWPQAFPRDYRQVRPLALGISRDIAAHLPAQPLGRISNAIGIFQYLLGPAYFRAVLRGGPRYDLNGNPRGEVTPEEQARAKRALAAFFAGRKSRAGSSDATLCEGAAT